MMTESAPLIITFTSPFSSLIMAVILFLPLVNSMMFKSSNLNWTVFSKSSRTFFNSTMMKFSSSLPKNVYPKYQAAFTKASSSGEEALYLI